MTMWRRTSKCYGDEVITLLWRVCVDMFGMISISCCLNIQSSVFLKDHCGGIYTIGGWNLPSNFISSPSTKDIRVFSNGNQGHADDRDPAQKGCGWFERVFLQIGNGPLCWIIVYISWFSSVNSLQELKIEQLKKVDDVSTYSKCRAFGWM